MSLSCPDETAGTKNILNSILDAISWMLTCFVILKTWITLRIEEFILIWCHCLDESSVGTRVLRLTNESVVRFGGRVRWTLIPSDVLMKPLHLQVLQGYTTVNIFNKFQMGARTRTVRLFNMFGVRESLLTITLTCPVHAWVLWIESKTG